jgi:hypothetical protein
MAEDILEDETRVGKTWIVRRLFDQRGSEDPAEAEPRNS